MNQSVVIPAHMIISIVNGKQDKLPSVFLFLFCGSLEDIICCDVLLFVFCALCGEFSCSWILFFNADFIWALIILIKIDTF